MQVFNSPCSGSPWDSAAAAAAAAGMTPASSGSHALTARPDRRLSLRLTSRARHMARGALVVLATPALLRNYFNRSSVTLRARPASAGARTTQTPRAGGGRPRRGLPLLLLLLLRPQPPAGKTHCTPGLLKQRGAKAALRGCWGTSVTWWLAKIRVFLNDT